MITLHPISAGQGIDYLLSTVASDDQAVGKRDLHRYLSSGGDTPGQWIGRGAEQLGVAGQTVTQHAADAIFKYAVHPSTGEPLGTAWRRYRSVEERYQAMLAKEPNASQARQDELRARAEAAGERTARAGWEMVFSPVKSFSILWGLASDEQRRRLEAVEHAAFSAVFQRIEGQVTYTRDGYNGVAQVEADGLTAAVFVHRSSRSGDPTFHRHVAISGKVQRDGRWLALDARPLHRMTVSFSELYTAELEREMAREFGILAAPRSETVRSDKRAVREYLGVSNAAIKGFSSRRAQTERNLARLMNEYRVREGHEPGRAEQYRLAQVAALMARPEKKARSIAQERASWRSRASNYGIARPRRVLAHAGAASRTAQTAPTVPFQMLPQMVITELEHHRSTWTRPNVEAEALRQLAATGWHLSAEYDLPTLARAVTDAALSTTYCEQIEPPALVPVPGVYLRADGTPIFQQVASTRFTSHTMRRNEQAVIRAAAEPGQARVLSAAQVDTALAAGDERRGFRASDEQRAIIHKVFARSHTVTALIGRAGTGKTTIMSLIREVADAYGIATIGLANGQVQADNLGDAASIRTENLARWLTMSTNYRQGETDWTLPPGAIVVIDEAGQATTPDIAAVLAQVQATGGRLLPVGDPLQLGAVGSGGLLAELEMRAGALYLTEVRRFHDANNKLRQWEIQAASAVAAGNADTSYREYALRGRIHAGGHDAMLEAAYLAYMADQRDGLSAILIAPDNAAAAALSHRVRTARIEAGQVRDTRRSVELADGNRASDGDIVATRRNDRRITSVGGRGYIRNGDVWHVTTAHRDGRLSVQHVISGARATLPADYVTVSVDLGYAVTKDRAQGLTVDVGHAMVTPLMDRNGLYPASTRGRRANHLYLVTAAPIDLETGEPGEQLTARQVWAGVIARDGIDQAAGAAQRSAWDEAGTLRSIYGQLRYAVEDIANDRLAALVISELRATGQAIVSAPAWPTLRTLMLQVEAAGADPVSVLLNAAAARELGSARDKAAVLHHRLTASETVQELLADLESSQTGAPGGGDLLARVGIIMPPEDENSAKHEFARALAEEFTRRAEQVATLALAGAGDEFGWATAYGPLPEPSEQAEHWQQRLADGAIYRDLTGHTDTDDVLGPAPVVGNTELRRLWRSAAPQAPAIEQRATALVAAASGLRWLDALGPVPDGADPRYETWMTAAIATLRYRTLWEYGREDVALGPRPHDPVQAEDYDAASSALAVLRTSTVPTSIALRRAEEPDLAAAARREATARSSAAAADRALADLYLAQNAASAMLQSADDAENRAAAAAIQARASSTRQSRQLAEELARAAAAARAAAGEAEQTLTSAQEEHERYVPQALEERTAAATARAARVELERRRAAEQSAPPQTLAWSSRPLGHLSTEQLAAAHRDAINAALAADQAASQLPRAATQPVEPADVERTAREAYRRLAGQVEAVHLYEEHQEAAGHAAERAEELSGQIAALQARLEARSGLGRAQVRGQERGLFQSELDELRAQHARILEELRGHQTEIQDALTAAGPTEQHQAALDQWDDALVLVGEQLVADQGTADPRAVEMAQLASESRAHAAAVRDEMRVRQTMEPDQLATENRERQQHAAQRELEAALNQDPEIEDAQVAQIQDDRSMNFEL